jgi:polyisoprenoid-binding protein YceI
MTTPNGNEAAPAGQTAPAYPEPGSFQLDPARSAVSITHKTIWGLVTVRGSFAKVSGAAEILPDSSGRGRLEIDASSLDTKNAKRDEHLRSKDFFKAADHAQIIVDLTEAARHGSDTVTATGTLTVAGQTRPLSLTAHRDQPGRLRHDLEPARHAEGERARQRHRQVRPPAGRLR